MGNKIHHKYITLAIVQNCQPAVQWLLDQSAFPLSKDALLVYGIAPEKLVGKILSLGAGGGDYFVSALEYPVEFLGSPTNGRIGVHQWLQERANQLGDSGHPINCQTIEPRPPA